MAELIIKEIPEKTDTLPALVYRVYLYADFPQNREIGFIDAHTGSLRMTGPAFIDFSAQGTFTTRYSGSQQGITHHYQGGYHLVDSTRNAVIHTWNLEGRTDISSRVELTDNDNNWTQAEHRPNNNDMGLDVQWALQGIYDRLYNTHNINSMDDDADNDGNGFAINAHARYGDNHDNAYWIPTERVLLFGEGGDDFRSLASVDVVAHEFGHGITHFQIGWNSTIDQRAFNEGMSDIWAVIMEHRIRPNSVWQIGEQITKNHSCLRNIQNTNASNAMSQIANTYASPQYNSGNSYVRGGIFSHWFYLLVNGGTGVNALGRSYSVLGIGMDMAENLIVKAVYDGYLRFTTSYAQIRTSMVNAAREIAGTNSFLEHQIENAWYAVGVGNTQYQPSISGPSSVCNQATYSIENLPPGATVQWATSDTSIATIGATGVLTKIRNGACEVSAILSVNGIQIPVAPLSIWVGEKNIFLGVFFNNSHIAMGQVGQTYTVKSTTPGLSNNDEDYEWKIEPPRGRITGWIGKEAYLFAEYPGDYRISLRYNGACGWVNAGVLWFYVDDGGPSHSFTLSPNPATDMVTVRLEEETAEAVSEFGTRKITSPKVYEIQLWSAAALIRSYKTDLPAYTIPVSDLPRGMYFVRVTKDGKTYTKKLMKK